MTKVHVQTPLLFISHVVSVLLILVLMHAGTYL